MSCDKGQHDWADWGVCRACGEVWPGAYPMGGMTESDVARIHTWCPCSMGSGYGCTGDPRTCAANN